MTLGRDVRTVNLGLQKHFENIPQCPDEICCKMPGKRGLVLDFRWEQWDQSGWFDFFESRCPERCEIQARKTNKKGVEVN